MQNKLFACILAILMVFSIGMPIGSAASTTLFTEDFTNNWDRFGNGWSLVNTPLNGGQMIWSSESGYLRLSSTRGTGQEEQMANLSDPINLSGKDLKITAKMRHSSKLEWQEAYLMIHDGSKQLRITSFTTALASMGVNIASTFSTTDWYEFAVYIDSDTQKGYSFVSGPDGFYKFAPFTVTAGFNWSSARVRLGNRNNNGGGVSHADFEYFKIEESDEELPFPAGKTYYVDAEKGNDGNTGLSEGSAIKTIAKANTIELAAGDKLLFKSNQTFKGQLKPVGQGIDIRPIVIDRYGKGSPPLIDGSGNESAIMLTNQGNITIQNLEIINTGVTVSKRSGIFVNVGLWAGSGVGEIRNIVFRNLDIHDIKGISDHESGDMYTNAGIMVHKGNDASPQTYLNGFLVENCYIHDITVNGLNFNSWHETPLQYYHKNVIIRNNTVHTTGGDGLVVGMADNPIFEYNTCYYAGAGAAGHKYTGGVWSFQCHSPVFQYNDIGYTKGDGDFLGDSGATGTDIRSTGDHLYQYNYTHENVGGTFGTMEEYNENLGKVIFRYNISQNDGRYNCHDYSTLSPRRGNHYFHNNVFYSDTDEGFKIQDVSDKGFVNYYYNNIFDIKGPTIFNPHPNGAQFSNNIYIGEGAAAAVPASDPNPILLDPLFIDKGTAGDGPFTTDGYKLADNSPAIGAGCVNYYTNASLQAGAKNQVKDEDYWGNPINTSAPTIGAYEPPATEVSVTGITISGESSVYTKDKIRLSAEITSAYATNKFIKWTSQNPEIAAVRQEIIDGGVYGEVKGIYGGTTQITAETMDGTVVSAPFTVTVIQSVSGISAEKDMVISAGSAADLTENIIFDPNNSSDKSLIWNSSDTNIATFDNENTGIVSGISVGTALITAVTVDGGFSASFTLNVIAAGTFAISGNTTSSYNGKPISGVQYNVYADTDEGLAAPLGSGVTDASGNVLINIGFLPGGYIVKASRQGYSDKMKVVTIIDANISDADFSLDVAPLPAPKAELLFNEFGSKSVRDNVKDERYEQRMYKSYGAVSTRLSGSELVWHAAAALEQSDFAYTTPAKDGKDYSIKRTPQEGTDIARNGDAYEMTVTDMDLDPTNVMTNPGFENGSEGFGFDAGVTVADHDARTGDYCLNTNGSGKGFNAWVPVEGGKTYRYGGWGKLDDPNGTVWLGFKSYRKEDGSEYNPTELYARIAGTDYTYTSLSFTVPLDVTHAMVYGWQSDGSGVAYIDDLEIVSTSTSAYIWDKPGEGDNIGPKMSFRVKVPSAGNYTLQATAAGDPNGKTTPKAVYTSVDGGTVQQGQLNATRGTFTIGTFTGLTSGYHTIDVWAGQSGFTMDYMYLYSSGNPGEWVTPARENFFNNTASEKPAEVNLHSTDMKGPSGKPHDYVFDNTGSALMGLSGGLVGPVVNPASSSYTNDILVGAPSMRSATFSGWYYIPEQAFTDGSQIMPHAPAFNQSFHANTVSTLLGKDTQFRVFGSGNNKYTNGMLNFDIGNTWNKATLYSTSPKAYSDTGKWVFFAVTYSGNNKLVKFYKGTEQDSVEEIPLNETSILNLENLPASLPAYNSPFTIGNDNITGNSAFEGYIDNVRIYHSSLTAIDDGILTIEQLELLRAGDISGRDTYLAGGQVKNILTGGAVSGTVIKVFEASDAGAYKKLKAGAIISDNIDFTLDCALPTGEYTMQILSKSGGILDTRNFTVESEYYDFGEILITGDIEVIENAGFSVSKLEFESGGSAIYNIVDGTVTVDLKIANSNEAGNSISCVAAVYENGVLKSLQPSKLVFEDISEKTVPFDSLTITDAENSEIRIFIFDDINTIKPLLLNKVVLK